MEDNDEQNTNDTNSLENDPGARKKVSKKRSSFMLSKKKEKKPKSKSKKKEPIIVIPYLNQMPNEVLGIIFIFMEAKELVSKFDG